jgi:hypothetical protein
MILGHGGNFLKWSSNLKKGNGKGRERRGKEGERHMVVGYLENNQVHLTFLMYFLLCICICMAALVS